MTFDTNSGVFVMVMRRTNQQNVSKSVEDTEVFSDFCFTGLEKGGLDA